MSAIETREFTEYRFKTIEGLAYALANAQYGNVINFQLCEKEEYPAKIFVAYDSDTDDFMSVKIDKLFDDKDFALCFTSGADIYSEYLCTISEDNEDIPSNAKAICVKLCEWLNVEPSQELFILVPEDMVCEAIGEEYDVMEDPYLIFLADTDWDEKYLVGSIDDDPVGAVRRACEFIQNNKEDVLDRYVVIEDSNCDAVISIDDDYNLDICEYIFLEAAVEEMYEIATEFRGHSKTDDDEESADVVVKSKDAISYNVNGHTHELEIYLGDTILATVSDVYPHSNIHSLIDDTLYGMGYVWNEDGTVSKLPFLSGSSTESEVFIKSLTEKLEEASVAEKEDFLGYPISAEVLENFEECVKEVLAQMPGEEITKFGKKYSLIS